MTSSEPAFHSYLCTLVCRYKILRRGRRDRGSTCRGGTKKSSRSLRFGSAQASFHENLDGERKTATVLFADIKGSMELFVGHGISARTPSIVIWCSPPYLLISFAAAAL